MSLVDEILEWPSFTGVQLDFLQKNTSFGTSILKGGVKHGRARSPLGAHGQIVRPDVR